MVLEPGDVQLPFDPQRQFRRRAPLAIEIGFGSGRFLEWLAGRRPDWNLLGAEISPASHARAYRRLRSTETRNVKLLKASGEFGVREVAPDESVRHVFVNFPDPWPKERHRDRRLLTEEFLRVVAARLESGGTLRLTTDHAEYYDWALGQAAPLEYLTVEPEASAPFVETKYGRKWRREGKSIRHVAFRRSGPAPVVHRHIEERSTMHHATLRGTLPETLTDPDPGTRRLEDGVVAVVDVYERLADGELLLLVHIEESDLTQNVLVDVRPVGGDEDRLTVRIRRFNQPLMSDGTAAAVEHVAEWVESLVDGNEMIARQY